MSDPGKETRIAIFMAGCVFSIAVVATPAIAQYVVSEGWEWVRQGESRGVIASFYLGGCACFGAAVSCFAVAFSE